MIIIIITLVHQHRQIDIQDIQSPMLQELIEPDYPNKYDRPEEKKKQKSNT